MSAEEGGKEEQKIGLSKEELEYSLESAAVWANKFYVNVGPAVRISFLELYAPDGKQYPRSAVVMSHQDAISLYKLLQRLLKDTEAEIEKLKKSKDGESENG